MVDCLSANRIILNDDCFGITGIGDINVRFVDEYDNASATNKVLRVVAICGAALADENFLNLIELLYSLFGVKKLIQ